MTRYTMRATAHLAKKDVHRWVFAYGMDPGVEYTVRKWLSQRLDGFYCDLQAAYVPAATGARTHIVLQHPPAPTARAEGDEIIPVGLQDLNSLDAVKTLIKATGLNPNMSVCGWPFCLDDLGGVDDMEGGAA